MCSYTMQNHSLPVSDGDMPLQPFQSGCEGRIQIVRTRTHTVYLPCLSLAIQTRPCHINVLYCHQLFVLQAILGFPPTEGTWLCWTNNAACRCNDSRDSVMYCLQHGLVSQFQIPQKNLQSRACTNSGYQALQWSNNPDQKHTCLR